MKSFTSQDLPKQARELIYKKLNEEIAGKVPNSNNELRMKLLTVLKELEIHFKDLSWMPNDYHLDITYFHFDGKNANIEIHPVQTIKEKSFREEIEDIRRKVKL